MYAVPPPARGREAGLTLSQQPIWIIGRFKINSPALTYEVDEGAELQLITFSVCQRLPQHLKLLQPVPAHGSHTRPEFQLTTVHLEYIRIQKQQQAFCTWFPSGLLRCVVSYRLTDVSENLAAPTQVKGASASSHLCLDKVYC